MQNISKVCADIQTECGYEYRVREDLLELIHNPDCDQSWFTKDGRLLADPSDPHKRMPPAVSVRPEQLCTSFCVEEIHHEIDCHYSRLKHQTLFRVFNVTEPISGSTAESHDLWWILAPILVFFFIIILIVCLMWRKKISSCISRAARSGPANRNPESGVQMKLL